MSLRINTNIAAMNSYRSLSGTDKAMSSSLEKLSSGFRINKAADDAAGLSISQGLKSQIGGLTVAARNAQDGVNVAQTADGSLGEVESILQRMRDLAVQAANDGSQDSDAKAASQKEFGELSQELDKIAGTTKFGQQQLLSGSYKGTFQVGANAGETRTLDLSSTNSSLFSGITGFTATGLGLSNLDLTGAGTTYTSGLGQVDFTATTSPLTADDSVAITGGANAGTVNVDLSAVTWDTTGTADAAKANQAAVQAAYDKALSGKGVSATVDSFGGITFDTGGSVTAVTSSTYGTLTAGGTGTSGATTAISALDTAIKGVSSARSYIGAVQNRLEHTINNINVTTENLSASNSAIVDTDMAQEMVSFTRAQILSQAGTSMLAQANSASQNVLRLLQ